MTKFVHMPTSATPWGCEILHEGRYYRARAVTKDEAQAGAEQLRDGSYAGVKARDA